MNTRVLGNVLGAVRLGVGASLVAAPAWAGRIWVGEDADGHGTKVFARALGARDVALGTGILVASTADDTAQVARLVRFGAIADVADVVATLIAWRNLEGNRRHLMPLLALAVGAAGVATSVAVERSSQIDEESGDEESNDQQAVVVELVDEEDVVDQAFAR